MSEDNKKQKGNKHSTGTVPKTKYRNNAAYSYNDCDSTRCLTNNLASDWHHSDYSNFVRIPRRNNNYSSMDSGVDDNLSPNLSNFSSHANGTNASGETSRRNSSCSNLKCDNVTKIPDKKQIEDKLSQIREYLSITNSLMTSMKNIDDQVKTDPDEIENLKQMASDLKDSEAKLVDILNAMESISENNNDSLNNQNQSTNNGDDNYSYPSTSYNQKNEQDAIDNTRQEIETLRNQQRALMKLQQEAENKLQDARHIQEKLYMSDMSNLCNKKDNNYPEQNFDMAIKDLEERAKRLTLPRGTNSNTNLQDKLLNEVDSLHNQIIGLHNANDERYQLIDILDNRDAELRTQHVELHGKLMELQNRKKQVDQLVAQLHIMDEAEEDDVGVQVRNIVTMKDQLSKLKDMLELVKNTENQEQNSNTAHEKRERSCDSCTKGENFLQKCTPFPPSQNSNASVNDNRYKQVNKNSRHGDDSKHRTSSISEKIALQNELEAKKRQLEELMGKHKAGTSNLNHDVGNDNKSEFSYTTNTLNETFGSDWIPLIPSQNRAGSTDRYSSDEQDGGNIYSTVPDIHNQFPYLSTGPPLPSSKRRSRENSHIEYGHNADIEGQSHRQDRNVRSNSVLTANSGRGRSRRNSNNPDHKVQVKQQLQLIKSVCESMLEQQSPNNQQQPSVHQLRNNLTPSPSYSEPRYGSLNPPHVPNTANSNEQPWISNNNINNGVNAKIPDIDSYQSWLATNTIQTQSFMLHTLNQCCQMLWLQQRELASLRSAVGMLQDRMVSFPLENGNILSPPSHHPPSGGQRSPTNRPSSKTNYVSAASSLPNLNQYNVVTTANTDPSYVNYNNAQNVRLMDQCLNNANHHLNETQSGGSSDHHAINNAPIVHGVNPINQIIPPPTHMWNGQALNNQVPPGNRANNYWDNFRSYSRQNLLSTKNNETFQNLASNNVERSSNIGNERTNPFAIPSLPKSNSQQDSSSKSVLEQTPQRCLPSSKVSRQTDINSLIGITPDVLNVNHNITKINEQQQNIPKCPSSETNYELTNGFHMIANSYAEAIPATTVSDVPKESAVADSERRNEWNNAIVNEDNLPKSKLFDELRENVYKEVASLISANEARPHFLIQLFRDLQMISSDPLRLKILQSIQSVITHSVMVSQVANRNYPMNQEIDETVDLRYPVPEPCSLQSTVWSKPAGLRDTTESAINKWEVDNGLKDIIPFLNDHEEEYFHQHILNELKQMILNSDSIQGTVRDPVFQKHCSNVLNEALEKYRGKRIHEVKLHLIQNIGDLLRDELSFIKLLEESSPENNSLNEERMLVNPCCINVNSSVGIQVENKSIQIENGDLAEADQSQPENNIEEEGAVGGVLENHLSEMAVSNVSSVNNEEVHINEIELPTLELSNNAEVLDQVPTRLPTSSRSRSTTPVMDKSSDHCEFRDHF